MKKFLKWAAIAFVALIVLIVALDPDSTTPEPAPTQETPSVETPTTEPEPVEPEPQGPVASFDDGTWKVGGDVKAGTYRADGGDTCYWAILKGPPSGDNIENILENDVGSSNVVVTLSVGQYFKTSDCGEWGK